IPNFFLQAEGIAKKVRDDISIVTPVGIIIYFFSHKFMFVFFLLVRVILILSILTNNLIYIWIFNDYFFNIILFFFFFFSINSNMPLAFSTSSTSSPIEYV